MALDNSYKSKHGRVGMEEGKWDVANVNGSNVKIEETFDHFCTAL